MQYSPVADPLTAAADLRARNVPFVMATVIRAVAPTSAKPGDKAVLTEGGLLVGWVGGSCAEPVVRKEAKAALRDGACRLLLITPEKIAHAGDGRSLHSMKCYSGGAIEIYLEVFLASPRLLVFGNSPVARAICDLGRVMRYDVMAVDLGERPPMGPDITTVCSLEAVPRQDQAQTYAVVSSHGAFDEESLEAALALELPYTGFVTSKRRRDQVFATLAARGVLAKHLERVRAPAGLDIGAREPEEIALSVMAEIVAMRRRGACTAQTMPSSAVMSTPTPEPITNLTSNAPNAKSCCSKKSVGDPAR
jgi:xanthine dehydrogenase accessory factor